MCLLVLGYRAFSGYPLVVAANRDERYARPAAPLAFWPDAPELCAGRDLEQGGTWLGITRAGRFAALTNFRRGPPVAGARSRGAVVVDYLRGQDAPERHAARLLQHADAFAGFSAIIGDRTHGAHYVCNIGDRSRPLGPGLYGLSNQWLDDPWPKVLRAKAGVRDVLASGRPSVRQLAQVMLDRSIPPDAALPDTGIGLPLERALGASFIAGEHYGTRAVSAILLDEHGDVRFYEASYGAHGVFAGERALVFRID